MNPYSEDSTPVFSMKDLFGEYKVVPTKKRQSERGELLRYFSQKTGKDIKFIAMKVQGMDLATLYYIKSACTDYELQGNPFAKAFNGIVAKIWNEGK